MGKTTPAERPSFRVCKHCGRDDGRAGPRPAGSMIRLIQGVMVYACSVPCWRSLGWSAP